MVNHRITRWIVAFAFGIVLSFYVFERISDPEPRMQRAREEAVVLAAREILKGYVAPQQSLEIVDPLAPNRKVGKVYVYPSYDGFDVSGHYRRDPNDNWHPFLMALDGTMRLVQLSVQDPDPGLAQRAAEDTRFSATP
jgi:hypothetical protein